MSKHINTIIEIKQQNPNTSLFDIIIEYTTDNEEIYDIDDFIAELRSHKGFKEYVKHDLQTFNFCKDLYIDNPFADLF